jgi:hypothetical protein
VFLNAPSDSMHDPLVQLFLLPFAALLIAVLVGSAGSRTEEEHPTRASAPGVGAVSLHPPRTGIDPPIRPNKRRSVRRGHRRGHHRSLFWPTPPTGES